MVKVLVGGFAQANKTGVQLIRGCLMLLLCAVLLFTFIPMNAMASESEVGVGKTVETGEPDYKDRHIDVSMDVETSDTGYVKYGETVVYTVTWTFKDECTIDFTYEVGDGVEIDSAYFVDKDTRTVESVKFDGAKATWTSSGELGDDSITVAIKCTIGGYELAKESVGELDNHLSVKVSPAGEDKYSVGLLLNTGIEKCIEKTAHEKGSAWKESEEIPFTIEWYNWTGEKAEKVVIEDKLDPGLDYIPEEEEEYKDDGGTFYYDEKTRILTWTFTDVENGAGGTIDFNLKLNEIGTRGVAPKNTAVIKIGGEKLESETIPQVEVQAPKKILMSDEDVKVGDLVVFDITGWVADEDYCRIVDTLDKRLTYVSSYVVGTSIKVETKELADGSTELTWILNELHLGDSFAIHVETRVNDKALAEDTIKNKAHMGYGMNSGVEYGEGVDTDEIEVHVIGDRTLVVSKRVTGTDADLNKQFHFTVTVDNTKLSGDYGVTFHQGKAEFDLRDGERIEIKDLPDGTQYTIQEDPVDGYTTTVSVDGTISAGSTAKGEIDSDGGKVRFVNHHGVGHLMVSNQIKGAGADPSKEFHFSVQLDDLSVNGAYGDLNFTNGYGEFTLSDGEYVIITDLPDGVEYTVTEQDANRDGYTTTSGDTEGYIDADQFARVSFVNDKPAAPTLVISKRVTGTDADLNRQFHFTVTVDDTKLSGDYGVTFHQGKAEFALRDGEHIEIRDLPVGTKYTIQEDPAEGYTTTVSVDGEINAGCTAKGEIDSDGGTVRFVNHNGVGHLMVSNQIKGAGADPSKEFHFSVQLDDRSVNGTYGDLEFTDGYGEFTLSDGEYVIITDLPDGVKYTVTEQDANQDGYTTTSGDLKFTDGYGEFTLSDGEYVTDLPDGVGYTATEQDANQDGYTTTSGDVKGYIEADQFARVAFVNEKPATPSLVVSKRVTGTDADPNRQFHFTVTVDDTKLSGDYGVTFDQGKAEFDLRDGEYIEIKDLPAGTKYTIQEDSADGYTTTVSVDGEINAGSTAKGEIDSDGGTVRFVNHHNGNGDLMVSNQIKGAGADPSKEFHFSVRLDDRSVNGAYGDLNFIDGYGGFTLSDGEYVIITDLPDGVEYTVTEQDANQDGYTTTSENTEGYIDADQFARVSFVNDKPATPTKELLNVADGDAVAPGDHLTYRISWYNDRGAAANVEITDTLDPNVVYVSSSNGGVYNPRTRTVSWHLRNQPAGQRGSVTLEVQVAESALEAGEVTNQAAVQVGNASEQETELVEVPIAERPQKTLLYPESGTAVSEGDQIGYSISWFNPKKDGSRVVIKDVLDKGVDFVSASNGGTYNPATRTVTWTLSPRLTEAKGSVTLVVAVNERALQERLITNQAEVRVGTGTAQKTEEVEVPVAEKPHKTLMYPESGTAVTVEDRIGYSISWYNGSENSARVVITDVLDKGVDFISASNGGTYDSATRTVTWILQNRQPGSSGKVSLVVAVNEKALEEHLITNQADVRVGTGTAQKTETVEVPVAEKPHKTLLYPETGKAAAVGEEIGYSISWYNNSEDSARVVITDPLDEGVDFVSASNGGTYNSATRTVTWDLQNRQPGSSGKVSLVVAVNEKALEEHLITNQADVRVGTGTAQKTDTVEVPVAEKPHKTLLYPETGKAAAVGEEIGYSISWYNNSEDSARVVITDPLDEGVDFVSASNGGTYNSATRTVTWDLQNRPSGSSGKVSLVVAVNEKALEEHLVTNQADVRVGTDPSQKTEVVSVQVGDGPHKKLLYPEQDTIVPEGGEIRYSISWYNNRGDGAKVTITDPLDDGVDFVSASNGGIYNPDTHTVTWMLDQQKTGASGAVTLTVQVNEKALQQGSVLNKATVQINGEAAAETETVTVRTDTEEPHKKLISPAEGTSVQVGSVLTYQITWRNVSGTAAVIEDALDSGVDFVRASGGVYDAGTHTVTWDIAEQTPGTVNTLTITVRVNSFAAAIGKVNNQASVNVDGTVKKTETVTVPVEREIIAQPVQPVKEEIEPGEGLAVEIGEMISYNITWKNQSNSDDTVIVRDTLESGVEYVSASSGGVYDPSTRTVTWTITGQKADTEGSVSLVVRVAAGAAASGKVANRATVQVGDAPSQSTNTVENPLKTGSLTVSKYAAGNTGEADRAWSFIITLDDTAVNGKFGALTFVHGQAQFTLKHGEKVQISGIPAGLSYTIREVEANQDEYRTRSRNASGVIGADKDIPVTFINSRGAEAETNTTGSMAVRKLVTGNLGDQNREFHFKTVLSDTGINGWSGDMEFTNGVAQFSLHSGEHLWARYLPVGTSYTVTETEADQEGYWTIVSGNEGVIYGISRLEARFQNHKGDWLPEYDDPWEDLPDPDVPQADIPDYPEQQDVPPATGEQWVILLWIVLMAASALGLTAVLTGKRRGK